MRRAPSTSPFWHNSNNSAWRSATTLPIPEIAPSAPSKKVAMSDIVKAASIATGRQLDRLLRPVGIDPCDDGALRAHLIERDREGAPALLARERRDLGGVAVGDDPGDTAGIGEPAQVLPVRGLVDREVRRERQEVRGHDPRELHHVDTSSVISLAGITRPYARPMISEWRSAETVRVRVTHSRQRRWPRPSVIATYGAHATARGLPQLCSVHKGGSICARASAQRLSPACCSPSSRQARCKPPPPPSARRLPTSR